MLDRQELRTRREELRRYLAEQHEEFADTPFTPEAREAFTNARAELAGIEEQLAELSERDSWLRTLASRPENTEGSYRGSTPRSDDGKQPFVYADTLQRATLGRKERFYDHPALRAYRQAREEVEAKQTAQFSGIGDLIRSISTTSGSAVVPQIWASEIIDRARNYAAVLQAGAQVVPMAAKTVQIGRLTVDPSAAFRTEGSTITASDPTFDNVTLTSKTMNCLVIGSLEWFADAPNSDQIISNAIAKALALQLDLVALFGGVTTGVEQGAVGNNLQPTGGLPNPPNPTGILANLLANAASSVLGAGANGTVQTAATFYGEVLDTIYTPRDFNEAPNALIWPSRLQRIYAKAADSTNQPMRQPPDVEAIPKYTSNQVPSGMTQGTGTLMADLFAGDFGELIIGQRLGFTVQTLTERYAELGQIGILATWRGDVQLARPRAFAVYRFLKGT